MVLCECLAETRLCYVTAVVYMERVVREVNIISHGRGVEMIDSKGNSWRVSQLFADDAVLLQNCL